MKKKILANLPLVVIGAFLIIYAGFGLVYFQKQGEMQNLEADMSLQRAILGKPKPDIVSLNSQLKQYSAEYEISMASLSNSRQGLDIYSTLVDLGRRSNTEVMSIEASPPVSAQTTNFNEDVLPYSVVVKGAQNDILSFISSLITGEQLPAGLELKTIEIQNGASFADPATLTLELDIHIWSDSPPPPPTPQASPLSGVKK